MDAVVEHSNKGCVNFIRHNIEIAKTGPSLCE